MFDEEAMEYAAEQGVDFSTDVKFDMDDESIGD